MEPSIITDLLTTFIGIFVQGSVRLQSDALLLLQLLATIELLLLGMRAALTHENIFPALLWKGIAIAVLAGVISQWPSMARALIRGAMAGGIKAGGDAISVGDLSDPGNIALYGLSVTAVVFQHLSEYTGISAMYNIVEIILSGWAACFVVLTYFVLAIWMFLVLLEFYAFTAIGILLLPFALNRHFAFLAEKTIGAICASAVQVLTLSFVTSAALPVLVSLQTGLTPTFRQIMVLLLGAMTLCALAWRAHKIANAIVHGAPQLTVQDVTQAAQTVVRTVQQISTGAASLRAATLNLGRRRT